MIPEFDTERQKFHPKEITDREIVDFGNCLIVKQWSILNGHSDRLSVGHRIRSTYTGGEENVETLGSIVVSPRLLADFRNGRQKCDLFADPEVRAMYKAGFMPFCIEESPSSIHVRHQHSQDEIFFILRGHLFLRQDGQELCYGKGALVQVNAHNTHEIIIGPSGASVFWSKR